jgi:hypothetical protein
VNLARDHQDPEQQRAAQKRRRASNDRLQGHHEDPSAPPPAFPQSLYADAAWIAANLPRIQAQVVADLIRLGVPEEDALDVFAEAVARLYARPIEQRPSALRDVGRLLRLVAFRLASNDRQRRERLVRMYSKIARAPDALDAAGPTETSLRCRAVAEELLVMAPVERAPLLRVLAQHFALEGVPAEAEPMLRLVLTAGADVCGEASDNRMRLSRARAQLRRRTREWLATVPLLRRDDPPKAVPLSVTAAACVASVIAATLPSGLGPSAAATTVGAKGGAVPIITTPLTTVATMTVDHAVRDAGRTQMRRDDVLAQWQQPETVEPPVGGGLIDGTQNGVSNHRRSPEDNSLLCVRNLRRVDDTCVPHPLLIGPEDVDPPVLVP